MSHPYDTCQENNRYQCNEKINSQGKIVKKNEELVGIPLQRPQHRRQIVKETPYHPNGIDIYSEDEDADYNNNTILKYKPQA